LHSADDDSNDVAHATIVFTSAIFVPKKIVYIDQLLGWFFSATVFGLGAFCCCRSQMQLRFAMTGSGSRKLDSRPLPPKNGELAKLTPAVFSAAE